MIEEKKLQQEGMAIQQISKILEPLEEDGKKSVVEYILKRFGVNVSSTSSKLDDSSARDDVSFKGVTTQQKKSTIEDGQPKSTVTDIRTFADLKKPKRIVEQVALVAFYLLEYANESEKTQEFGPEHIEKYCTQARFLSLSTRKKICMALTNTKNAGYIERIGTGKYKLTPVGFKLIKNDLPRDGLN